MPISQAPSIPPMKDVSIDLANYLRNNNTWVKANLDKAVLKDEGIGQIFLISPSRKVFSITVSDAGALVVTAVSPGKTAP